ncbi:hypothetical protein BHF71_09700 [Vulcanibacillus modesticaldus]|uniref:DUF4363 domain-containing protein n=1 Tax=Vulcanibacillus modesticaldus TaxID=337097 RepID=A0A1D2YU77_9BACI|nr:DUF4363 family protein [Vulcanibacillus modesticaldus]OEF99213.1 hypothetical protein BHF71_09700 [Vulcanibacillus modesticaldus]
MEKKLLIIGSVLMIVIYIAIMGSGAFLKQPLTKNDDVIKQLSLVENAVKKDDWQKAESHLDRGFQAWDRVKNRIQFSVEREFIEKLDDEMATLQGAISVNDKRTLLITIEKIKKIWDEMGK